MEELLASSSKKQIFITSGQEVEGTIISRSDNELIFDLGTKSDGVLSTKELSAEQIDKLKIGDKLKTFVVEMNNGSGQIVLSMQKQVKQERSFRGSGQRNIHWNKFVQAKSENSKLKGTVTEINKGGLVVEVDGVRGFLPGSQINAYLIGSLLSKEGDIVSQTVEVNVIEIDQQNNKLIFAQKGQVENSNLSQFKQNQKVNGKVVGIFPFALVVELENAYGTVFPSDMSWDKTEDPNTLFKTGEQIEAQVLGIEQDLSRVNLSIKALSKDPFAEVAQGFQADDVISGVVAAVTAQGVSFTLNEGVEGFMASNKQEQGLTYEVGKKMSLLVDSVDAQKRRVNVVPFLTSTSGLIYK